MDHRAASPLLAEHAQGGLAAPAAAAVEEHLSACADCRRWLQTYELLSRALAEQRAAEHPESAEIAAWAVGGDPPAAAAAHLAACEACARELELVAAAIAEARDESRARRRHGRRRIADAVAAAASIVFLLAAGWILVQERGATRAAPAIATGAGAGEEEASPRWVTASHMTIGDGSKVVFEGVDRVSFGEGFVVAAGGSLEVRRVERPEV